LYILSPRFSLPRQLWQLGDVRRNAPASFLVLRLAART
jgi:hypothetical protein